MQRLRFALRNLWRDLKSGELSVLLLALCVAVLSLTAVGFFTSRISQGVRAQAAEVLAADLRLESPIADPARYFDEAAARGLRSARGAWHFPTAIFNGDLSQLAALNAVSRQLSAARTPCALRTRLSASRANHRRIPGRGEVWVDARIIAQLKMPWAQCCASARPRFASREVLDYRPDQGTGFVNLAPAALAQL